MDKKIFSEKQVDVSALLAGPIPPGLLIYKNYKALGKDKEAYTSLAVTLIFTIGFFFALMQMPQSVLDKIPNFVFTAFYGALVFVFFRAFLAKDVNQAFENGAKKASNWTVTGLTILGFGINLAIILGLSINEPFYEGELLSVNGNELYYDAENVSIEDADKLVSQFKTNDFFGSNYGNIAKIELTGDIYLITMYVDESLWTDRDIINSLTSMKWLMEVEFGRKTDLKLESVSIAGISKYKDI
ncbi:MAG: hypothetical protein OEW67_11310 [Cyclobacteriaceae bacterium]|nr:hypothetical protein [Cyclobacteriaceae bacterium]